MRRRCTEGSKIVSLERLGTIFQAELKAITHCAYLAAEVVSGLQVIICTVIKNASQVLNNHKTKYLTYKSLKRLPGATRVTLLCVPVHQNNMIADDLTKLGP